MGKKYYHQGRHHGKGAGASACEAPQLKKGNSRTKKGTGTELFWPGSVKAQINLKKKVPG